MFVNLVNSLGFSLGTTLYNLFKPAWRQASDYIDRPPALVNGNKWIQFSDSHNQLEKQVIIVQDQPLPCTITGLDIHMVTTDEQ